MAVSGTVAPGFERVREAFSTGQSSDIGGAQLAVYQHGIKVVDLWAGTDPIRQRPFDGEGIAVLASVTKGITATIVHLLAQRGLMDYDAPVSKYWPEFAQNGKEKITVRQILSHSAGLSAFPVEAGIRAPDYPEGKKILRALEGMAPLWEPGTGFLYAPWAYGYLVGEIVKRVSGKSVGTLLREEIAGPLGLDLWIGLPEEQEARVIPWIIGKPPARSARNTSPPPTFNTSNPLVVAYGAAFAPSGVYELLNTREGHACELPAANAIGDARSLAKLYASLIGSVDGHEPVLKPATLERAIEPQTDDIPFASPYDAIFPPKSYRFALGYQRNSSVLPMIGDSSFGHVGSGGRLGFADIDSGIAVGYVCNNPSWDPVRPDPRWLPWLEALRDITKST